MTLKDVGVHWNALADNHTHMLDVGGVNLSGNSLNIDKVLFDLSIVAHLGTPRPQLITNTFTRNLFFYDDQDLTGQEIAQSVIIKNRPTF